MTDNSSTGRKKRIFSGMQPSGEAHLGNYLGALRRWVGMQDDYDCIWCIVDEHAITAGGDPARMPAMVFDLAVSYLAVGLDPEKAIIFVQSDVPEHTELAWLFNAVTPVGDLERMTQYKDKSQNLDSIPAGILNYPILQAADILLYKADAVPVGADQKQHLELTREIARKFNSAYGDTFPITEPLIGEDAGRIVGRSTTPFQSSPSPTMYGLACVAPSPIHSESGGMTRDARRSATCTLCMASSPTRRRGRTSTLGAAQARSGAWIVSACSPIILPTPSRRTASARSGTSRIRTRYAACSTMERERQARSPVRHSRRRSREWG
jgi:hypothetical protein